MAKIEIGEKLVYLILLVLIFVSLTIIEIDKNLNPTPKEKAVIISKNNNVVKVKFDDATVKVTKLSNAYVIGDTILIEK